MQQSRYEQAGLRRLEAPAESASLQQQVENQAFDT